jgi:hypothetical protein
MSWSAQYEWNEDGLLVLKSESNLATLEAEQQHDEALIAFANIMDSGAMGNFDKYTYSLTLSGHANEKHEPAEGWANDCLTLTITQTGLRKVDANESE